MDRPKCHAPQAHCLARSSLTDSATSTANRAVCMAPEGILALQAHSGCGLGRPKDEVRQGGSAVHGVEQAGLDGGKVRAP